MAKFASVIAGVPADGASVKAPVVKLTVAALALCPDTMMDAELIGANIPNVLTSIAMRE
ncbi:hypothetical protein D3C87_2159320 [compost metagenome]